MGNAFDSPQARRKQALQPGQPLMHGYEGPYTGAAPPSQTRWSPSDRAYGAAPFVLPSTTSSLDKGFAEHASVLPLAKKQAGAGARTCPGNLALVFLPWILFTLVMLPFALFAEVTPFLSWLMFSASMVISLALTLRSQPREPAEPFALKHRVVGVTCVVMTILACLLGLYCYDRFTREYYSYASGRFYTNVIPTEDPDAKRDGRIFSFAEGTRVDTTMSVGYSEGDVYCAAPVVTDGLASAGAAAGWAGYWAVGVNCCRVRGVFRCGDVFEGSPNGMAVLPGDPNLEMYTNAALQSASAFELRLPEKPMFLLWTADPMEVRDALWDSAVLFYVACSSVAAGLVGAGLLALVCLARGARRA